MRGFPIEKKRVTITAVSILLIIAIGCGVTAYIIHRNYLVLPEAGTLYTEEEESFPFDKFDILLLGLDGRDDLNDRTDTIILLSIDSSIKKGRILSIPRDTRVQLRQGSYDKINAAYVYGGAELTKKAVGELLNVYVDRVAIVDFEGVVDLVNMLKGVDVDVPVRMYVPLEGIDLKAGPQHLDGEDALAYMRFRGTAGGDIDRIVRQQEVLVKLAKKLFTFSHIFNISRFIETALEKMDTDLAFNELTALASIAPQLIENGLEVYVLPGENRKIDSIWYYLADVGALRDEFNQAATPALTAGR